MLSSFVNPNLTCRASCAFGSITFRVYNAMSCGDNFYCTDSDYQNNVACYNAGHSWGINEEELEVESICYIDAHPENVYVFDQYSWMQQWCFPIQEDW